MSRRSVPTWLVLAAVTLAPAAALAETNQSSDPSDPSAPRAAGSRLVVPTPPAQFATPLAQISGTLYLERCKGGCTVTGTGERGMNDARAMLSSIPKNLGPQTISEYRNGAGLTGALADTEWSLLVQCMREVYLPFNVAVTDVKPTTGTYHMAIIAGSPVEVGFGSDVLGVAPLANDCSPQDNVISFSFANAHPQIETRSRVDNLCWTAAQESAHAFGLDHEYEFLADKRSACSDPMTYRVDCGGQKYFRNASASCGETGSRPCQCGATQNSHQKLLSVFDAGTTPLPPPAVTLSFPRATDTMLGSTVAAVASSKRGVAKVELRINGFPWAEAKGAPFGVNGQSETKYTIQVPASLPNSIVDVQVRAYDDLGMFADSDVVTVTRGAPCTSADGCAKGQKCDQGKCLWDPPTGELGDECSYPQFCVSGICRGTADQQICTQDCFPEVEASCPSGYTCVPTEAGKGICFFPDDGGCCSTARGGRVPWAPFSLAALTLGLLVRPWRRRRR